MTTPLSLTLRLLRYWIRSRITASNFAHSIAAIQGLTDLIHYLKQRDEPPILHTLPMDEIKRLD